MSSTQGHTGRNWQSELEPAYIWNLEKWYWWIYFQGSNGEIDIKNRPMDMGGREEGDGEMYGESNMETYNTISKIYSQ